MRPLVFLIVAVAGALALASCSDDPVSSPAPFEDIQSGEIEFAFDPSGTAATLEVDTTIPVVCAVVYGDTEAFGLIATDDDMRGGAHSDHAPLLTGLVPDTEYLYVLQGVAADGTLYRSAVMHFSTPAPTEASPGARNVAAGSTVVDVSSEFSDAFGAENAIDGDLATEWSSDGDGDDAFIEIDVGASVDAIGVAFQTRSMTDGSAIVETYTVTVDGGPSLGPFTATDVLAVSDVSATGRVFRFDAASTTGGNTGAVEVAVYVDGS